jgi:DNA-binding transcriptional ArsR family regulator
MLRVLDIGNEPCANMARRLREEAEPTHMAFDALAVLVEEYARHVERLVRPKASPASLEFAYSRLLGARGNICRLCPADAMAELPRRTHDRWAWAESQLHEALSDPTRLETFALIARKVEDGWAESIERYVITLSARLSDTEIADQLGILKGIDTVGMHLAQREIFQLSDALTLPLENAQAVKLRVRLLSLFLTLHRCGFCAAFPAIQSYRRTFRIYDPVAYPWWFVDCRLTERQLNWNFKRMPIEDLTWRF